MARSNRRRNALLALACMAPLLAACTAILGIDDYERAECSGGGACLADGGNVIDTGTDTGRDAGPDVTPIDAAGTAPVSWIQFKMPNYPEAVVPPPPNNPTYTPTTGGGVKDDISGLVWRPVPDTEKSEKKFEEAKKLCEGVPAAKHRLPTRIELITLLDFTSLNNVTAKADFKLEKATYWTSSSYRALPTGSTVAQVTTLNWAVSFKPSGEFMETLETAGDSPATARVICVQDL